MRIRAMLSALWRNLVHRRAIDHELSAELESYVELLAVEKMKSGLTRDAARRAALLELGGMDQVREEVRDVRIGALVERTLKDAAYAMRALIRSPGFALAAILALALGIGVTTSIFSLVYGVLLKPLPFPQPAELVRVWMSNPPQGIEKDITSYPQFRAWRERNKTFEHLVVARGVTVNLTGEGEPEEVPAVTVTEGYFAMYGVSPLLGTPFTPEQESPDGEPAVVLSYDLWTTRFGSDRGIIGRTIQVNGVGMPVVGVMPPGFNEARLWMPLHMRGRNEGLRDAWGALWLPVFGRVRDGVTVAQAQADMTRIGRAISEEQASARGTGVLLEPLHASMVGTSRTPLLLLLGAVTLVLLIACANIANLLLARGTTRRTELSVRIALGAGRGALVRQVLVESIVLGLVGGVLGTALAWGGTAFLVKIGSQSLPRLDAVRVDLTVLAFSLAASLVASILFGAVPALDVARHQPGELMRAGGRGSVKGASGVRPVLVAGQFALAVVLLYSAGLLMRSFSNLLTIDRGFEAHGVLAANINLSGQRYPNPDAIRQFWAEFLPQARALPGVSSADVVGSLLHTRLPNSASISVEGKELSETDRNLPVAFDGITPGFLQTMRMPLLRGRHFTESDDQNGEYVGIVNEAFVARFLKGEDPIGRRFTFGAPDSTSQWIRIVGVVRDAKRAELTENVAPYTFLPMPQTARTRMQLIVRTTGDPLQVVPHLREALRRIDPQQPLANIRTIEQDLAKTLAPRKFVMLLLGTFAVAAVLLAAIGIYGVISYMVGRRTREFGLRMALGAEPRQVLQLVMRQAGKQVLTGLVLGSAGALAAARLLGTQLYGVSGFDQWTQGAVILLLTAVAAVAVWLPARKATGADPLIALRAE